MKTYTERTNSNDKALVKLELSSLNSITGGDNPLTVNQDDSVTIRIDYHTTRERDLVVHFDVNEVTDDFDSANQNSESVE